ncbi:transcriptional regulator, TetR family (plasmid) [Ketogulonicigenium robustum]|uniref:Transcriptional regulator, TetR family n=1 Tax=Ketogulonicigenium robustum TaxID=92947 RepID=A0A1W6P3F3_9RHOB|nr:transcriptional regulator, TetR family [Ketogulonicigenium robustum]
MVAEAIRKAALRLVRERGYRNVSIGAIAQAAGVARQTLYNRWHAKADLILDAVFEETGRRADDQLPLETGDASRDRLERLLIGVFNHLRADGDTLRALIAAAQEDSEFREAFRERFVAPRETIVTDILAEALRRGELSREADPDTLSTMIHGAFWYRLLNGRELDHELARSIARSVFP